MSKMSIGEGRHVDKRLYKRLHLKTAEVGCKDRFIEHTFKQQCFFHQLLLKPLYSKLFA